MASNKIPSKSPAGKNDEVDIKVMIIEQILEQERNNKVKTVVTNSAERKLLLSTDLDKGVSIKVENGGKPQDIAR